MLCRFPADEPRRAQWIRQVRRVDLVTKKEWHPGKYSVLCSEHFKSDAFKQDRGVTLLKPDAVPTIFNIPQLTVSKYIIYFTTEGTTILWLQKCALTFSVK